MNNLRKKGEIEAEISEALIKFEKEYMGRGPTEVKTYIFDDIIFVRLKGVLTKAELQLVESGEKKREGIELIKKIRQILIEKARDTLEAVVKDITGANIISLHTDISTKTGERIIIFILKNKIF